MQEQLEELADEIRKLAPDEPVNVVFTVSRGDPWMMPVSVAVLIGDALDPARIVVTSVSISGARAVAIEKLKEIEASDERLLARVRAQVEPKGWQLVPKVKEAA